MELYTLLEYECLRLADILYILYKYTFKLSQQFFKQFQGGCLHITSYFYLKVIIIVQYCCLLSRVMCNWSNSFFVTFTRTSAKLYLGIMKWEKSLLLFISNPVGAHRRVQIWSIHVLMQWLSLCIKIAHLYYSSIKMI